MRKNNIFMVHLMKTFNVWMFDFELFLVSFDPTEYGHCLLKVIVGLIEAGPQ